MSGKQVLIYSVQDKCMHQKQSMYIHDVYSSTMMSSLPLQLTSALISSLLNRHTGDSGLSDTLSARLRETTPTLFSHDDATESKAQELLTVAAGLPNKYEQVNMLRDSLKVCTCVCVHVSLSMPFSLSHSLCLQHFSQVTHQVNLSAVCSKYQQVAYYEGVIELCTCAASRMDPQGLALHYYKSGQPQDDIFGQRSFLERY